MKKFALIAVIAIAGISVFADEISDSITANLKTAVKNGKCDDAEKWANALHEYNQALTAAEQAQAIKTANKTIAVFDNILTSLPALANGFIRYSHESPWFTQDADLDALRMLASTAAILTERPLTADEVNRVATAFSDAEKKRKEEADRLYKKVKEDLDRKLK